MQFELNDFRRMYENSYTWMHQRNWNIQTSRTKDDCALLDHNADSSGNFLPTFRENLSVPSSGFKNPKYFVSFLNPEDGTDRLSRNVCNKLPLLCVMVQRKQFSDTSRRRSKITQVDTQHIQHNFIFEFSKFIHTTGYSFDNGPKRYLQNRNA